MEWTATQRTPRGRARERIGLRPGERIANPADARLVTPEAFLGMLKRIPGGVGLAGWLEALQCRAAQYGCGSAPPDRARPVGDVGCDAERLLVPGQRDVVCGHAPVHLEDVTGWWDGWSADGVLFRADGITGCRIFGSTTHVLAS